MAERIKAAAPFRFSPKLSTGPQTGTAEGIIRVMSNHMLSTLTQLTPDDLMKVDPAKLVREANTLVRVTSHKRRVDSQNNDEWNNGLKVAKNIIFDTLRDSYPYLSIQIVDALYELRKAQLRFKSD